MLIFRLIREKMSDVGAATFVGVFQKYSTAKMFFPVFKVSGTCIIRTHLDYVTQPYDI